MPTKPRRSLAEYKKDVNEARLRRKLKEVQNKKVLKQHGIVYMKSEQNILMGCIHVETNSGETSSTADNQDMVVPIQSIVVDIEPKPPQETLVRETVTETSASCNAGVVHNRLCGHLVLHHFIG